MTLLHSTADQTAALPMTPEQNARIIDITTITSGSVQSVDVTSGTATAHVLDGKRDVEYLVGIDSTGKVTRWDQRFTDHGILALAADGCNPAGLSDWHDSFGFGTSEVFLDTLDAAA